MRTVKLESRSTERYGSLNFVVAVDQDGLYYAYRDTEPYFCFEGISEDEVRDKVARAAELFSTIKTK